MKRKALSQEGLIDVAKKINKEFENLHALHAAVLAKQVEESMRSERIYSHTWVPKRPGWWERYRESGMVNSYNGPIHM